MISFLKKLFGKNKESEKTEKTELEKMYDLVETIREDKTEEIYDINKRLNDMEEQIHLMTANIASFQTQLVQKTDKNETLNIIPQLKNDISDLECSFEHTKKDLLSRFNVLGKVSINNRSEIEAIKREILNTSFNKKTPGRKKEPIKVKLN
ncbi:MAG: hypothetical protein KAI55_04355 [Candidatus Aenigmarchaeota archaeon]|nr:hypothetical protein [Candidatus Aenigmarchaeota archaeon]